MLKALKNMHFDPLLSKKTTDYYHEIFIGIRFYRFFRYSIRLYFSIGYLNTLVFVSGYNKCLANKQNVI